MLECQCCGHDVICHFAILDKYQRFWMDVDSRLLFGSGLCQSLRHLSQEWSATLESSVGLRTINERINQIEPLLEQARRKKSPMYLRWCNLMASGSASRRKRRPSSWTNADASGISAGEESGVARRAWLLD